MRRMACQGARQCSPCRPHLAGRERQVSRPRVTLLPQHARRAPHVPGAKLLCRTHQHQLLSKNQAAVGNLHHHPQQRRRAGGDGGRAAPARRGGAGAGAGWGKAAAGSGGGAGSLWPAAEGLLQGRQAVGCWGGLENGNSLKAVPRAKKAAAWGQRKCKPAVAAPATMRARAHLAHCSGLHRHVQGLVAPARAACGEEGGSSGVRGSAAVVEGRPPPWLAARASQTALRADASPSTPMQGRRPKTRANAAIAERRRSWLECRARPSAAQARATRWASTIRCRWRGRAPIWGGLPRRPATLCGRRSGASRAECCRSASGILAKPVAGLQSNEAVLLGAFGSTTAAVRQSFNSGHPGCGPRPGVPPPTTAPAPSQSSLETRICCMQLHFYIVRAPKAALLQTMDGRR